MTGLRLYVTPASPWVRRVVVSILELGIGDRFEFVQTRWPHSWAARSVAHRSDLPAATPVERIPALVASDLHLVDSHAICDYLNGELGGFRLLARDGPARWRALADISIANAILEAHIARRAEVLRIDGERSADSSTRCANARCAAIVRSTGGRRISLRPSTSPRSPSPSPAAITTGATRRTAGATQHPDWRPGSIASPSSLQCARPSLPRLRRRSSPA